MERTYRASNALFFYVAFLVLDALVLAFEAFVRIRTDRLPSGVFLALLALGCAGLAALVFLRWGRLRVVITPETMTVWGGDGRPQHVEWADVERVREMTGPAYQLSLKELLPGPYLPHGLVQGETVLEVSSRPRQRILLRRSLVNGFGALRQDVQRSVPKDAEIDLHARWWRD